MIKKVFICLIGLAFTALMLFNVGLTLEQDNVSIVLDVTVENAIAQGEGGGAGCLVAVWVPTLIGGVRGSKCSNCNNVRIKKCTFWTDCSGNEHVTGC